MGSVVARRSPGGYPPDMGSNSATSCRCRSGTSGPTCSPDTIARAERSAVSASGSTSNRCVYKSSTLAPSARYTVRNGALKLSANPADSRTRTCNVTVTFPSLTFVRPDYHTGLVFVALYMLPSAMEKLRKKPGKEALRRWISASRYPPRGGAGARR